MNGDAEIPAMDSSSHEVTRVLHELRGHPLQLREKLYPLLYSALKQIARRQLRAESNQRTLQPTALVNEAYLKLANSPPGWANRAHFLACASHAMRQVLIEAGRKHRAKKRDVLMEPEFSEEITPGRSLSLDDVMAVDTALHRLKEIDPRKAEVLELKFFGGLSTEEAATAMGLGLTQTKLHLKVAKAWMLRELAPSRALVEKTKKRPATFSRSTH